MPVPPGRRRGSSAGSSSGSGMARSERRTSAVGSGYSISCPVVGRTSPGPSAFRSRSSTGSIPSAPASRSIWASTAKAGWFAPKPRIAPAGGWLVRSAQPSTSARMHRYGPRAK